MSDPRLITSLTNERVKLIRSLAMRKARKEAGLYVAEGASVVLSARDSGARPETLVVLAGAEATGMTREIVQWAGSAGADVLAVSEPVMAKLAAKDNPQTVLGVFRQRWSDPPEPGRVPDSAVWIALEAVRDPGNLGTIVRTVHAAGGAGVILVGACCDPYARESVRATMGSIFAVPLVRMAPEGFVALQAAWQGDVVGTHLAAREDFRSARYPGPVLLVMGSEGPGLSQAVAAACRHLVKIPMAGATDSLNLAVASALLLYQIRGPRLAL